MKHSAASPPNILPWCSHKSPFTLPEFQVRASAGVTLNHASRTATSVFNDWDPRDPKPYKEHHSIRNT
eukprot:3942613-Amphidinium_carterae.1